MPSHLLYQGCARAQLLEALVAEEGQATRQDLKRLAADLKPEQFRQAMLRLRQDGHVRELVEITTTGQDALTRMHKRRAPKPEPKPNAPTVAEVRKSVEEFEGVRWP